MTDRSASPTFGCNNHLRRVSSLETKEPEPKSCNEYQIALALESLICSLSQSLFTHNYVQLQRYAERVAKNPELVQTLTDLVLASRTITRDLQQDELVTTAASNAISILNYGSRRGMFPFRFSDQYDWSGIRVPGANLNHALMVSCNFNHADLSNSILYQVNLHESLFQGANLSGVRMRETLVLANPVRDSPCVAISPDGQVAASYINIGDICIWDLNTGKSIGMLQGHAHSIDHLSFSQDGKYLRSTSRDHIRIWDCATLECISAITLQSVTSLRSVAFHSDGNQIVVLMSGYTLGIWDLATPGPTVGATKLNLPKLLDFYRNVNCLDWSPDGKYVAAGLDEGLLCIWDALTAASIEVFKDHTDDVSAVAFSPDSQTLASGSCDCNIRIWNIASRECIAVLKGHTSYVVSLQYLHDGRSLVSVSSDGSIRIWNPDTHNCVAVILDRLKPGLALGVSADGKRLILGEKAHIRVWDMDAIRESCNRAPQGHDEAIECLACTPDGKYLASGSSDMTVRVWETQTGRCVQMLTGYATSVKCLSFASDGSTLASVEDQSEVIQLWNTVTWECVDTLEGHAAPVTVVCHSPQGQYMASGSKDGTVRLWPDMSISALQAAITSLRFCPNNAVLAIGADDGMICLWDIEAGEYLTKPFKAHRRAVLSLGFSPCGEYLVSGGMDGYIHVWTVATRDCVTLPREHLEDITYVQYYQSNHTVISGTADNTIRIWDVNLKRCVAMYEVPVHDVSYVGPSATQITQLCLIDGDHTLATVSAGYIRIWQMATVAIDKRVEAIQQRDDPETKADAEFAVASPSSSQTTSGVSKASRTSAPEPLSSSSPKILELRLLRILGAYYPTDLSGTDFTGAIMDEHLKDIIAVYK